MKSLIFMALLVITGLGLGKLFFYSYGKFKARGKENTQAVAPKRGDLVDATDKLKSTNDDGRAVRRDIAKAPPLTVTGVLIRGRQLRVYTSDGARYHGEDGVIQFVQSDRVMIRGVWVNIAPAPVLAASPVFGPLVRPADVLREIQGAGAK